MFHKIKSVLCLENYVIRVHFSEGATKIYDLKPLFNEIPVFNNLKKNNLYHECRVDVGGNGIVWNDDIDLSGEEIFTNGKDLKSPFNGLMSFHDATDIWGLNESTLRKAVVYGKLIEGIDVCKFGKQWVVLVSSMKREYGDPK